MRVVILLLLCSRIGAESFHLNVKGTVNLFDGEYEWDDVKKLYERVQIDDHTGFKEYIEWNGTVWELKSESNDLESDTTIVTISSGESLELDKDGALDWSIQRMPNPNNRWVVNLDKNAVESFTSPPSPFSQFVDPWGKSPFDIVIENLREWTGRDIVLYGRWELLHTFAFYATSKNAREIKKQLDTWGLVASFESECIGVVKDWGRDYLTNFKPQWDPGTLTGNGTYVFIFDTGIAPTHPLLSGKVDQTLSKNYINPMSSWEDDHGHGTHVASIAAGVAPNANLVSVKVLDSQGTGYSTSIINAANDIFTKVASLGADGIIFSMSLGFAVTVPSIDSLINTAYDVYAIQTVVAAGNAGADTCSQGASPQSARTSIAVGSLISHEDPTLSYFSNYGDCSIPFRQKVEDYDLNALRLSGYTCAHSIIASITTFQSASDQCYDLQSQCYGVLKKDCDVAVGPFYICTSAPYSYPGHCVYNIPSHKNVETYAPGSNIIGANWLGGTISKSGTSMACPYVSGLLALLIERQFTTVSTFGVEEQIIEGSCRADPNIIHSNGYSRIKGCVTSAKLIHNYQENYTETPWFPNVLPDHNTPSTRNVLIGIVTLVAVAGIIGAVGSVSYAPSGAKYSVFPQRSHIQYSIMPVLNAVKTK
jgi:subtilisin family serine protease